MKPKLIFDKVKIKWLVIFMLISGCVEQIDFAVPGAQFFTVIDGFISDNPGPYTISISKGFSLNADSLIRTPVENAKVTLFADGGVEESFIEKEPGIYITGGIIRGQVGNSYHIRVETSDGNIFESEPDKLSPVGELEEIRYEFEARTRVEPFGEIAANVFNIYVDADAGSGSENFVRWKFKGTYKVITHPALHYTWVPPYTPYKNPFPCSGYILVNGPAGSGGLLEQIGDCTCCECWAAHYEPSPQLSDTQLISNNQFKNIKVGEVPISNATLNDKYLVEVEQMSLSRKTFDFFRLVRTQKESSSSLFQPPSGEIRGNIKSLNSSNQVIGIFWATSLKKKSIFIYPTDVPYPLVPMDFITTPCYNSYPNATTTKPELWQ